MINSLSYHTYKYEHGISAAEQRAADVRAGEAARALRDLRLALGHVFRRGHHVPPARQAVGTAASARILSGVR
jgi:hypothetical protein